MPKLLLTVDDVYELPGRGIIVSPSIPLHELPQPIPSIVSVRSSDGVLVSVEAVFSILMGVGAPQHEPAYTCLLKGMSKASVPIGATIYTQS